VAFATPGGYIWISKGALLMVQTEGELAALMCHELGHVAKEHAIQAYIEANGGEVKPNPWVKALGGGLPGNFGNFVGGLADKIAQDGYGEDQEFEADQWGIVALQMAGYSHKDMFRLFDRVKSWQTKHPTEERYLKNHPEIDARIEKLKDFVEDSDNAPLFDFVVDPNSVKRQEVRFKKLIH
jgi:beta-barrel assembly-enhancing protease